MSEVEPPQKHSEISKPNFLWKTKRLQIRQLFSPPLSQVTLLVERFCNYSWQNGPDKIGSVWWENMYTQGQVQIDKKKQTQVQ